MTSKRGSSGYQSTAVTVLNRTNRRSFFRYRQTLTIRSAAISSVSSPRSCLPPVTAFGSALTSSDTSGRLLSSSAIIKPLDIFMVGIRPVEGSFFPDEEETAKNQNDENQHLDEG